MSRADDGAPAARILAWSYLLVFAFLSSAGRAFYSSQGLEPTARFELVCRWVGLTLLWLLARAEARKTRSALPMDTALFIGVFSFLAFPLLLWRRGNRWRSVATATTLYGVWFGGYVCTAALHSILVSLQ